MEENRVLLTLVIPIYNRENIVYDIYKMLMNFDFPDVQIVIIDDGSTDNTLNSIKKHFQFKNSQFVIETITNSGPGGARNKGVEISKGKYIWFVDSDDFVNSDVYFLLKGIESKNYDLINFDITTSKGEKEKSFLSECPEGEIILNDNELYNFKASFGRIVTKLYNREIWVKNKILFPQDCFYEDNLLLFYLPFLFKNIYNSKIIGYIYKLENESITRTTTVNYRSFGRFITAYEGIKYIWSNKLDKRDLEIFFLKFNELFVTNSLSLIYRPQLDSPFVLFKNLAILYSVYFSILKELKQIHPKFYYKTPHLRGGRIKIVNLLWFYSVKTWILLFGNKYTINYYYFILQRKVKV